MGVAYRAETKRMDFDTKSGHVLLLELTSQVTLDEGGLQRNKLLATRSNGWGKQKGMPSAQVEGSMLAKRANAVVVRKLDKGRG